jgi:hypothetical protein
MPVAISGAQRDVANRTDAAGVLTFSATAPACGRTPLVAHFDGQGAYQASSDGRTVLVCGYLAFIPPWLAIIPWWGWALLALAALAAYLAFPRLRDRYATTISRGPALTILATEPTDGEAGLASVGETFGATAFLEAPLPDGHRLRMGTHDHMEELPIDAELRARWLHVADRQGEFTVRADILDGRGRVVTRRTIVLRAVRYAEEIESRYLALRKAKGMHAAVSPREFETWLRERSPDLDPHVARRLVAVFEEADYGPREAGRQELLEYLAAEGSLTEVKAPALV